MTHHVYGMIVAICLLAGVRPGWGQQFVYVPKPAGAEDKAQKADGVLVQEVPVRKGDTLYGISRTFSGRGSYYPQILLFNDIKDPNLIYPGTVLRIPLPRSGVVVPTAIPRTSSQPSGTPSAGPAGAVSATSLKSADNIDEKKRDVRGKAAVPAHMPKQAGAAAAATPEQRLYERAIKAYRQNDYRTALELFDRFLADHPSSDLAADASLYKAECYLKLSNQ